MRKKKTNQEAFTDGVRSLRLAPNPKVPDRTTRDGKKYDRAILMLAEKAVAGLVQGQISLFDAKAILAAVKDANTYTDIEMDTLRYLRDHYKWAGEADTHFRNAINAWNLEGHD